MNYHNGKTPHVGDAIFGRTANQEPRAGIVTAIGTNGETLSVALAPSGTATLPTHRCIRAADVIPVGDADP